MTSEKVVSKIRTSMRESSKPRKVETKPSGSRKPSDSKTSSQAGDLAAKYGSKTSNAKPPVSKSSTSTSKSRTSTSTSSKPSSQSSSSSRKPTIEVSVAKPKATSRTTESSRRSEGASKTSSRSRPDPPSSKPDKSFSSSRRPSNTFKTTAPESSSRSVSKSQPSKLSSSRDPSVTTKSRSTRDDKALSSTRSRPSQDNTKERRRTSDGVKSENTTGRDRTRLTKSDKDKQRATKSLNEIEDNRGTEREEKTRNRTDHRSSLSKAALVAAPTAAALLSPSVVYGSHEGESGDSQHSLETQESGISVTTPQQLSREDSDEVEEEVEESISSRLVEVDDAEVVDEVDVDDPDVVDEMIVVADDEPPIVEEMDEIVEESGLTEEFATQEGVEEGQDTIFDEIEEQEDLNDLRNIQDAVIHKADEEDSEDESYGDDFEDYDSDFEESDADQDDEENNSDDEQEASDDDDEEDEKDTVSDGEVAVEPTESAAPGAAQSVDGTPLNAMDINQETARQLVRHKTSKGFVNFAKLKEKHGVNQIGSQKDSRGQTLLSMIRLDTISLDLLTLQPINYEAFISSFGLHNTLQAGVQTNEDNLAQDTQTDVVLTLNKWTQQPISVDVGPNMKEPPTPQDYLGVGGDVEEVDSSEEVFGARAAGDVGRLTKFLSAASQVVLTLLEEQAGINSIINYDEGELTKGNGPGGVGFSPFGVLLGGGVPMLAGTRVTCIQFSVSDPSIVVTGHSYETEMAERQTAPKTSDIDALGDGVRRNGGEGGLICVWSVHEPSQPRHLLRCHSVPAALTLCPGRPLVVVAGLKDATLAAWDLREPAHLHPLFGKNAEEWEVGEGAVTTAGRWRLRVPSFITACNSSEDDSSSSPVIALQTLEPKLDSVQEAENVGAFQVVSLTGGGEVVWWVVVQERSGRVVVAGEDAVEVSSHEGAAPWSRLVITRAHSITLQTPGGSDGLTALPCTGLQLNPRDSNALYVSTGTGAVRHFSRVSQRMHPPAYLPELEPGCSSTCVTPCPHPSPYLLVGGSDGSVRLHGESAARPLATWPPPDPLEPRPVQAIMWSAERPCVFYVHEEKCLHVWDLSAGDMLPVATLSSKVLTGEDGPMVSCIAPSRLHSRHVVNAVFGSSSGRLILRTVDQDFLSTSKEEYNTELERFNYYVNII